jgi:pimeloyl-ACP methyl ester carboxylesterase
MKPARKPYLLPVLVVIALIIPAFASASVIAAQFDHSVQNNFDGTYNVVMQPLGTGLSGTLGSISFFVNDTANVTGANLIHFEECPTPPDVTRGYQAAIFGCVGTYAYAGTSSMPHVATVQISHTLNPSKYYMIMYEGVSAFSSQTSVYGTISTSSLPAAGCARNSGTAPYPCAFTTAYVVLDTEPFPTATSTPLATTTDPCTENCNSNVLFLPGLQASRLYEPLVCNEAQTLCKTEQLWEPQGDTLALRLRHDTNGLSINQDIYTHDVIDNAYVPIKGNVYKSFLDDMDQLKRDHVINDWKAIPYDWRLTPDQILSSGKVLYDGDGISYMDATSSPYIIQELKRLAANSKTGKVAIIAHSNGGLVTKRMTELLGADAPKLIDKIILVASPQAGTPQAIGAILHGDDQALPFEFFPYALSREAARSLALNMPGAYNLLPSAAYFTQVDDPVVTIDAVTLPEWASKYGTTIHSGERLRNFLTDTTRTKPDYADLVMPEVGNATVFDQAANLHTTLDNWIPPQGVELIQIAGWGIPTTMSGVKYSSKPTCSRVASVVILGHTSYYCAEWTPVVAVDTASVIDGDGTVVVPSALWTSVAAATNYWVNLARYNNKHPVSTIAGFAPFKHANILEVNELRSFLTDILTSSVKPLSQYTYLSTEAPISTESRLRYALHSPLSLDLYDSEGRHTGISTTTGEIDEEIPGTYYSEFGDVKYVFTDASTTSHIVMNGYATGTFTLNIEELQGDTLIASTTFKDIPTTPDTTVTLTVQSDITTVGTMNVDVDADGALDFILTPRLNDTVTPQNPKIPLTVTASNKTIFLGTSIPMLTATLSGFQNGDIATSTTSGTAFCTTTATSGSPVGTYPITCTIGTLVSDKYDFATFVTGTLTIIYKWSGFTQPINDTAYNPSQSLSVFRGGSTVPVKFQLKHANGTPVRSATSPTWLTPQKLSPMSASIDEPIYSIPATSGTTYHYDELAQQYVYNWSTKGLAIGYWYRIYAKLEDGNIYSVVVGLR